MNGTERCVLFTLYFVLAFITLGVMNQLGACELAAHDARQQHAAHVNTMIDELEEARTRIREIEGSC